MRKANTRACTWLLGLATPSTLIWFHIFVPTFFQGAPSSVHSSFPPFICTTILWDRWSWKMMTGSRLSRKLHSWVEIWTWILQVRIQPQYYPGSQAFMYLDWAKCKVPILSCSIQWAQPSKLCFPFLCCLCQWSVRHRLLSLFLFFLGQDGFISWILLASPLLSWRQLWSLLGKLSSPSGLKASIVIVARYDICTRRVAFKSAFK